MINKCRAILYSLITVFWVWVIINVIIMLPGILAGASGASACTTPRLRIGYVFTGFSLGCPIGSWLWSAP